MANKNKNEMSDIDKAEALLAKLRECMLQLIDVTCAVESELVESDTLEFDDWLTVAAGVAGIRQIYYRLISLEALQLKLIEQTYLLSKNGGES